jgi:hypothetical protein
MEHLNPIIAHNPDYPERYAEIQVVHRKNIEEGTENKERIKGIVKSFGKDRFVNLIRRNFDGSPYIDPINRKIALQTQNNWKLFREAGLPTYNTLRVVQDGSILVTDECADGSRTYGNPDFWESLKNGNVLRSKEDTEIDNIFIDLTSPEKIGPIIQRANDISEIATNHNINLPFRDPLELIVHPNGSWDLKTLDVAETRQAQDEYGANEVKHLNSSCGEWVSAYLQRTRDELINYQKKSQILKLTGYLRHRADLLKHDLWLKYQIHRPF